jgi:hypothetical protein
LQPFALIIGAETADFEGKFRFAKTAVVEWHFQKKIPRHFVFKIELLINPRIIFPIGFWRFGST